METQNKSTYAFISTTSTTFHPENPLENAIIDNPGLVRRRRRKTSARELEVLEMAFRECEKPSREVREEIARKTGMDGKAVQIWFQNRRQSSRRPPKALQANKENSVPLGNSLPLAAPVQQRIHPNIPYQSSSNAPARIPLSVKTNHGPLSPLSKTIQKPSLETTCLSSCVPKRAPMKRTPSIRLGEGVGGKATVVFEETEVLPKRNTVHDENTAVKRSKPNHKSSRVKRVQRDDPGKENIPPLIPLEPRRSTNREPRSADLEEIALGLVALRDGR